MYKNNKNRGKNTFRLQITNLKDTNNMKEKAFFRLANASLIIF